MSVGSDIAYEYISDLNFGAAELLRNEIDAAIAAAVQAERDACAAVAAIYGVECAQGHGQREATAACNHVAAAIRARG